MIMKVEMKKLAAQFEPKLQLYFASLAFDYVLHHFQFFVAAVRALSEQLLRTESREIL